MFAFRTNVVRFSSEKGDIVPVQDLFTSLRDQNPLVQCITNFVSMNVAANVVLAAGASPAMFTPTKKSPISPRSVAAGD